MNEIKRLDAVMISAFGAIGGPVAAWAIFTDNKIIEQIVHRSPFPETVTVICLFVVCWGIFGMIPAGIIAFVLANQSDPLTEDGLGCLIWWWILFGTCLIIAILGSAFVATTFHISAGMMIIAWLLAAILLTLVIITVRSRPRSVS